MSEKLMAIARLGYLLARPGEPAEKLEATLEIVGEVSGSDMAALYLLPGFEQPVAEQVEWWRKPADAVAWREDADEAESVWAELVEFGTVQIPVDDSSLPGFETLKATGIGFAGFYRVIIGGVEGGALCIFKRDEHPFDADDSLFLQIAAGATGNYLSNLAVVDGLRNEQQAYKSMVDEVQGIVFRTDAECRIELMNQRGRDLRGPSTSEIRSSSLVDLFVESERPTVEHRVEKVIQLGEGSQRFFTHLDRGSNRDPLEVEVIFHPVTDKDGNCTGIVGSIFDATPQRRSVDLLAHELKRESLSVMAGGIAHDFNNLLQSMLTSADILAERIPEDDEDYEFIELIRTSGHRMGELTGQLRAFARGGNPVPRRLALAKTLHEVLESPRFMGESRVRVKVRVAKSLKPVDADPTQMFQVFYNVAANAFEAIEESRGSLNIVGRNVEIDENHPVVAEYGLDPGPYVEITFADSGRGISDSDIKRIFDPFFTTKGLGAGLGLAAAQGIVDAHGGTMDVQSVVGSGTTVRIYLPAADSD